MGSVPRFAPKMGKYGHLDPLLMSVAPETPPMCSPGHEFIYKFQGLSLKMKIDFTLSIKKFFHTGPKIGPGTKIWAQKWENMAIWTPC